MSLWKLRVPTKEFCPPVADFCGRRCRTYRPVPRHARNGPVFESAVGPSDADQKKLHCDDDALEFKKVEFCEFYLS